ncbi:MAG: efflux RND transporter periplasmic adaptor subunit, partial [Campylobacterota bacterium]|nr:efflux RND transporter periplasmic adaptor subunit [Campylobacterota bacterium]
ILTDLTHLKIIVEISETDLKYVELGKKLDIMIPSIKFKTVGTISSIIPSSNPMTHKFKMKIEFDMKDKSIYPGMYAKVIIKS